MKAVLLHSWPHDETMWETQLPVLESAGFEAITPRLYGRGPSIDGWAAQLLGEVDGTFVAVGASMGGYTALALARRAPERVVGIVLAGSRADADSDERRRSREEEIAMLRASGAPPELETDVPVEELAIAQEAIRDRADSTGVVASFGGPLLVCVGAADHVVSVEEAGAIARSALRGSLEVFQGAGHIVSVDQPDRFAAVLTEFLAQWRT